MKIRDIKKILVENNIEPNEAEREAYMFVEHFLNLNSVKLAINPEFEETKELREAINLRITKRIPIQHILKSAYFAGEYFYVNKDVLIPRDETEILVRKAIQIINDYKLKKVLDIGTGSGCIACTIAKNTDAQVLGVDISTSALSIALDNSSRLNLYNKAIFRKSDIYSNLHPDEIFDFIISNPPYIPYTQKELLQKEVLFDPPSALFTNDSKGLEFYDKIIREAKNHLTKDGFLAFELGINQSFDVKNIMEECDFANIEIIKDLAHIDRVIIGRRK